uniref:Uncharacterized protein n=1 Tax=Chromera velia CCMP2878 TaxID=1169474 RepID=A0A0G4HBU3_9ALVE|eukprot:Cvel_923.t1-p1 / transcript=Cvel_923.t1 / gene=Cvel_923 / organism=Chromera_velia_CCMP2878 / gene_product=hypothetical protein / transcript_product=hypothetical protein / location=Cvel_scaffold29:90774-92123(+) / protein_length=450 / sequence_SO=supercontig / SO=protein_coding / is_pseudo=false
MASHLPLQEPSSPQNANADSPLSGTGKAGLQPSASMPNIKPKKLDQLERPSTPIDLKKSLSSRIVKVPSFTQMLPRKPIDSDFVFHEGLNEDDLGFDLHQTLRRHLVGGPYIQDFDKDLPRPSPAREVIAPVYKPNWGAVRLNMGISIPDMDRMSNRPPPESWQGGGKDYCDIDRSLSRACPASSSVKKILGFSLSKQTARPDITKAPPPMRDPEAEQVVLVQEMRRTIEYKWVRPSMRQPVRFSKQTTRAQNFLGMKAAAGQTALCGKPALTDGCAVQFVPVETKDPGCTRRRESVSSPLFNRTAPRAAYDHLKKGGRGGGDGTFVEKAEVGGGFRNPTVNASSAVSFPGRGEGANKHSSTVYTTGGVSNAMTEGGKGGSVASRTPVFDPQKHEGWTVKVVPARQRASEFPTQFRRQLRQSESKPNLRTLSDFSCQIRALRKTRSHAFL